MKLTGPIGSMAGAALWCILLVGSPGVMSARAADTIVLRPGAGPLPAGLGDEVSVVGPAGVGLSAPGGPRMVSWELVQKVEGGGPRAAEAAALADLGESVWRGKIRVERGDWGGAEARLRPLTTIAGLDGPTGVVVWEGLLRCDLARGARESGVRSWLSLLGTLERGSVAKGQPFAPPADWLGGRIAGSPVIDGKLGLAPGLPPMWIGESAVEAAARDGQWRRVFDVQESGKGPDRVPFARALAGAYDAAARLESGLEVGLERQAFEHEGVRLVRLIVLARSGNEQERAGARSSLETIGSGAGQEGWVSAWCRAGIGRSLIREPGESTRVEGVLELLRCAADPAPPVPHIVAICLAEASRTMQELKDPTSAGILKRELLTRYPSDAASRWSELDGVATASPAGPQEAEEEESRASKMVRPGGTRR